MAESSLPPLFVILSSHATATAHSPLADALSTLLEPSPVLLNTLVPQLASHITLSPPLVSYTQLIDRAFDIVRAWDNAQKSLFIHGHPRIGDVNLLSQMSAQEQGGGSAISTAALPAPTPPEVLARLMFLNECYERRYPGLVYITFVNGRSRAQIKDEMEEKLTMEGVLPSRNSGQEVADIEPHDVTGEVWQKELDRAIEDVARIAKSRLGKLGVE